MTILIINGQSEYALTKDIFAGIYFFVKYK